jgi:hypothetical protein
VQGAELEMYKTNGSREPMTDIDILTQNEAFQVKDGKAGGLVEQLKITSAIAGGRKAIGIVTKSATKTTVNNARNAGFEVIVIQNKNDISATISQYLKQKK